MVSGNHDILEGLDYLGFSASSRAGPQTKPTEYNFAPIKAFRLFGGYTAGTNAAFGDGSIRFIEEALDRSELKAIFKCDFSDEKALRDLFN